MNFNKSYILMKNLLLLFFLIICQVGNSSCVNDEFNANRYNNQFIITSNYHQSRVLQDELITEESDSSDIKFEFTVIKKAIQISPKEIPYAHLESDKITQFAIFQLYYGLPPPNANRRI
jgi:hypothetical protein